MNDGLVDSLAIRDVVEKWVLYSDSGDWEKFAALWHPQGWMSATWFQAPGLEFVKARKAGFEKGVSIIHLLGAHASEIVGARATAQTKMIISQRAPVHGVLCDVVCTGRFFDFFEKVSGRWLMVRRQPIYEKDRMDPVDPAATVKLDPALLNRFPEGYRHLAYLQTQAGFKPKEKGMPGLKGPEVEKLYAEGKAWLAGSEKAGVPG